MDYGRPADEVLLDFFLVPRELPVLVDIRVVLVCQDPAEFLAALDGRGEEVFVFTDLHAGHVSQPGTRVIYPGAELFLTKPVCESPFTTKCFVLSFLASSSEVNHER